MTTTDTVVDLAAVRHDRQTKAIEARDPDVVVTIEWRMGQRGEDLVSRFDVEAWTPTGNPPSPLWLAEEMIKIGNEMKDKFKRAEDAE